MAKYMLLLRDNGTFDSGISPEEIQAIIQRYGDWRDALRKRGKLAASNKLSDGEGKLVRRNGSSLAVTDGPFAEAKEVIGGYFLLEADSYDEALALSRDCPHLDFGSIEIRRVDELPG
ncbi:MAG: YciI family protein [Thermoanaerobaculia bacterium]